MYSSSTVSQTEYDRPEAICRNAADSRDTTRKAVMASLMSRGTCEEAPRQYLLS